MYRGPRTSRYVHHGYGFHEGESIKHIHTDSSPRRQVPIGILRQLHRRSVTPKISGQSSRNRASVASYKDTAFVASRFSYFMAHVLGSQLRRFTVLLIHSPTRNTSTLGMYRSLWLSRRRHEWHVHRRQGYTAVDIQGELTGSGPRVTRRVPSTRTHHLADRFLYGEHGPVMGSWHSQSVC